MSMEDLAVVSQWAEFHADGGAVGGWLSLGLMPWRGGGEAVRVMVAEIISL